MTIFTIVCILLPLFVGFSIYLLPRAARYCAIAMTLMSMALSQVLLMSSDVLELHLIDDFGVTLLADSLSGYFILGNALVTAAVVLYCWQQNKSAFFFTQMTIVHGSVNAVFVCADLISLYVALEVIGIAAFLLIAYPRTNRSIWVGLRYLFVSNTAMLFYLLGAVLVYQTTGSFAFSGLHQAPMDAIALILLGLLTKGGIFVSGLWLPLTHAESETPVSALLSGAVVNAGVFPLVRCAQMVDDLLPILQFVSVATALLGVGYALLARDTKRMLASSTISQLGFVLASPAVAGIYALSHGVAKATLFLGASHLPSRSFSELRQQPMALPLWGVLALASLSISGMPLLSGFGAKVLTLQTVSTWQSVGLTVAAIGTAAAFAKFMFLPFSSVSTAAKPVSAGLWTAVLLLLTTLIAANGFALDSYTLANIYKALAVIVAGWLLHSLLIRQLDIDVPRSTEKFDHLIGAMSLILLLLFGIGVVS